MKLRKWIVAAMRNPRGMNLRILFYLNDQLLRWARWSAKTAIEMRALGRQNARLEEEVRGLRREANALLEQNNWLMEREFNFESQQDRSEMAMEYHLGVRYESGPRENRQRHQTAMAVPYLQVERLRSSREVLFAVVRDALAAHVVQMLCRAMGDELGAQRGAEAVARQKKGPR